MARIIHPEDGTVYACPSCNKAGDVFERAGEPQAKDRLPYRCHTCGTSFGEEDLVERPSLKNGGVTIGPTSDIGQAALEAEPEDLGLSPIGEVPDA